MFQSSSNASEFKNDNNEARVMASAAAKVSEHLSTKDAEILRLIEGRRRHTQRRETTTEKIVQVHQKWIRKKKNQETTRHLKNS